MGKSYRYNPDDDYGYGRNKNNYNKKKFRKQKIQKDKRNFRRDNEIEDDTDPKKFLSNYSYE